VVVAVAVAVVVAMDELPLTVTRWSSSAGPTFTAASIRSFDVSCVLASC
ncbi:hypothetical protein Tco_0485688, partial [Tanacetum coccineum]